LVLNPFVRDRAMEIGGALMKKASLKGAAASDVIFSSNTGHMLSLMDGFPEENSSGIDLGIGLRTIDAEGRQGIAYVNSIENDDLDNLLEWSWNNCRISEPDHDVVLYEGAFVRSGVTTADPEIRSIVPEYRLSICSEMTEIASNSDARVESVRSAYWVDGYGEILYMSSTGFCGWYEGSSASCGVAVVLKGKEGMEMGGYDFESRLLAGLDPNAVASEAVKRTAAVIDGSPIPTGRYDLILDPEATASLLEVLGDLFLAPNIHKGKSLLKGRLGEKVASKGLTIVDDGTLPWGNASAPFDGEGYPTGRTVLLEDGVVNSFLYNLKYAKLDAVRPTGNAARGVSTLPDVDVSNMFVEPGPTGPGEILHSAAKAIYVMEFLGLHTVDPVSGDFSVGIKGVFVESGEYTRSVSGMTVAGNIMEFLDRIDKIGNDLKFFGNIGGCTLMVKDVAAAGL